MNTDRIGVHLCSRWLHFVQFMQTSQYLRPRCLTRTFDRTSSCLLLDSGLAFYEYGWRCPPHPTSVSWPTQGVIRAEARPMARSGPQARLGVLVRRRERGLPGSGERPSLVAAGQVARLG